jgi:predicted nucleic acid-binding protein
LGLIEAVGAGPVALDTAPFIYFIEEHPQYAPVVKPLFEAIDDGAVEAVTTGITLIEALVVPLRLNDRELADRYEDLLTGSRGLRLLDLDERSSEPLLRSARQAASAFRTPSRSLAPCAPAAPR